MYFLGVGIQLWCVDVEGVLVLHVTTAWGSRKLDNLLRVGAGIAFHEST